MNRRPVLAILVPAFVILHFFLHLGLGIGQRAPDFLTVALLLAVREVGMGPGAGIGFFFGLLEDSFSVLAFGANTVALTLVGVLGARTRDLFVGESVAFHFWYLASGIWVKGLLHWVVAGEGLREPFLNVVLVDGSVVALYGGLVGAVFLIPFGGNRRLNP